MNHKDSTIGIHPITMKRNSPTNALWRNDFDLRAISMIGNDYHSED